MHFCSNCENMYYIRINEEDANKLVYYCQQCGNEDANIAIEDVCVLRTQIKKKQQSMHNIINKYTKLDPTLPRINTILCPNAECATNTKNEEKEVIYIRYDDANMKYIYLCCKCDTVWNTNEYF